MKKLHRGTVYARALLRELRKEDSSPNVREIAQALNLVIVEAPADGFDGALVRADGFPVGAVVIRESIREPSRKDFTIAHELGHYLLPGHEGTPSVCSSSEVANWADRSRHMEREADEFAAELLMPVSLVYPITKSMPPSIAVIERIANHFHASLSSAAWRFCDVTRDRCAVVWATNGQIQWVKRSRWFGYSLRRGTPVPEGSLASDCFAKAEVPREPKHVPGDVWIKSKALPSGAVILEQVKELPNYQSVISLLWIRDDAVAASGLDIK